MLGFRLKSSGRTVAGRSVALIGSSPAIRRVRDRIERVAATDFTCLIEGGSGPQPHPGFIEVFCEAAFYNGDGEVEGAGEDDRKELKWSVSSLLELPTMLRLAGDLPVDLP